MAKTKVKNVSSNGVTRTTNTYEAMKNLRQNRKPAFANPGVYSSTVADPIEADRGDLYSVRRKMNEKK